MNYFTGKAVIGGVMVIGGYSASVVYFGGVSNAVLAVVKWVSPALISIPPIVQAPVPIVQAPVIIPIPPVIVIPPI